MKIISLAFAAAVFFGLASSANAGEYIGGKQAHTILAEGEVLHATDRPGATPYGHVFTVRYEGQIYSCQAKHHQQNNVVYCFTDKF